MDYLEYIAGLERWRELGELREYARVVEEGKPYPLYRFHLPGKRYLTITAGFHGDEQAGPLTLRERLGDVVAHARSRGVGLRIYPCVNPSGFEACTRYNRSGERPNNDLLRYEVAPGLWQGELTDSQQFLRWAVFLEGPKETRALRACLQADPTPAAALDIHQDPSLHGRLAYAYTFGDRAPYQDLMQECTRWGGIAGNTLVDEAAHLHTGSDGLIEYHDGSVTDYFLRRGVPYTAALETTLDTPLEACHEINLIWIRGFIDFAAG